MIILKLNKILIAILLLSVFTVGTMNFAETVEAASWKKIDSYSVNVKNPDPDFNNKVLYTTFIKGNVNIKTDIFMHKNNTGKKVSMGTVYINKKGNKISLYSIKNGKKSKTKTVTYTGPIRDVYELSKNTGLLYNPFFL